MHSEFVDRSRPKTHSDPFGLIIKDSANQSILQKKNWIWPFSYKNVCVCMYVYIYRLQLHYTCTTKPGSKNIIYWCWLSEKVTLLISSSKKVIIIYYKSKANQDWYYKNHGYSDKKCQVIIINHFNNHTHRIHGACIYANIWGILMVKYGKC